MTDSAPQPPRPRSTWRGRLYETIFEHDTAAGRLFDVLLLLVILFSIVVVMLESVEGFRLRHGAMLRSVEWTLTILFTVEYVARLASHPRPRVYAFSFYGIVDLLSILPTYLSALIPGTQGLAVIRTLRILRVFRVLKLARFVRQGDQLKRALAASLPKIIVFLIAVVCLTTIFGAFMYLIEGPTHGFTSIPRGVYWAIVTLTTVGYGDVAPETSFGQFLASLIMIFGYGVIAVPTGIVTAELTRSPRPVSGQVCAGCSREGHDVDAKFCKACGTSLHAEHGGAPIAT